MAKFTELSSKMLPLPINDIDTDQIIPARFLKATDKKGMGDNLFADWRYNSDGSPKAEFALNDPQFSGAQILVAGDNFGCGSSREHAPWALTGFGFRAVVSTSFADIFKNNALKNGLLPIEVDEETHRKLLSVVNSDPNASAKIDLAKNTFSIGDIEAKFPVDPFAKECLLKGVDELGYIQSFMNDIEAFERGRDDRAN